VTPSQTPTLSGVYAFVTVTATVTQTITVTPSTTPSPSLIVLTVTQTVTVTATRTPSASRSVSASTSLSSSQSAAPTSTQSSTPSLSPGSFVFVTVTATATFIIEPVPSATPAPPNICAQLGDGLFCGVSESEAAARVAVLAANGTVSPCTLHFFQCASGVNFGLQVVSPGTLCFNGLLYNTFDPVCAGGDVPSGATPTPTPTPDPLCPTGDGIYCDVQCGRYFYYCVHGRSTPLQATYPGTVCFNEPSLGLTYLTHENDVRCFDPPLCNFGDPNEVVCYQPPGQNNTCTQQLYNCGGDGEPLQLLSVALGTACYRGYLIRANDPVVSVEELCWGP
jgi:hypothetical protein